MACAKYFLKCLVFAVICYPSSLGWANWKFLDGNVDLSLPDVVWVDDHYEMRDPVVARLYYQMAADQNLADAQYNLASRSRIPLVSTRG